MKEQTGVSGLLLPVGQVSEEGKHLKMINFREFEKELTAAERFGNLAVRETCKSGLEQCGNDYEGLAQLSYYLLHAAERANRKKDNDLTGTYLLMIMDSWEYARDNLSQEDYHIFCSYGRDNVNHTMYADMLIELEYALENVGKKRPSVKS